MERSGEVVRSFYRASSSGTSRKPASTSGITTRLDIKVVIGEGKDAAVFFELETKAPAEAVTLVAEWHQVRDGKIYNVASAFDGRPFAACSRAREELSYLIQLGSL